MKTKAGRLIVNRQPPQPVEDVYHGHNELPRKPARRALLPFAVRPSRLSVRRDKVSLIGQADADLAASALGEERSLHRGRLRHFFVEGLEPHVMFFVGEVVQGQASLQGGGYSVFHANSSDGMSA
ncbi:hypothetical protein [Caenispirillum salinarum]|uniref:hypothetical protein n=1 Tax=Caenispirillum salinarum TaxID=859058 RepID=UPI00384C5405